MVRWAASVAARLSCSRMRFRSVTKRIMPPRSAKPSASLTVRTGRFLRPAKMARGRSPSDRLMNRIWPAFQALIAHGSVQGAAERIIAENADHERRVGGGKGFGRPIDELREVEQEHGLHLVFRGPHGLRGQPARHHEQRNEGKRPRRAAERRAQKCHSTNPYTPRSISRRV